MSSKPALEVTVTSITSDIPQEKCVFDKPVLGVTVTSLTSYIPHEKGMFYKPALGATVTSFTSESLRRKVCLTSQLLE